MSLVSIITPVYNRSALLKKAIESALTQTYSQFEYIIVDDGSDEDIQSVVESYNDPRITYIRHETNQMIAAAFNTGIKHAKGEYVALLESDDVWYPEKLEQQLVEMKRTGAGASYCGMDVIDPNGNVLRKRRCRGVGNVFAACMKKNIVNSMSTLVFQRELVSKTEMLFDPTFNFGTDYDFVFMLAKETTFACVKGPLVTYLEHDNNASDELDRNHALRLGVHEQLVKKHRKSFFRHPILFSRRMITIGYLRKQTGDIRGARKAFMFALVLFPFSLGAVRGILRTF